MQRTRTPPRWAVHPLPVTAVSGSAVRGVARGLTTPARSRACRGPGGRCNSAAWPRATPGVVSRQLPTSGDSGCRRIGIGSARGRQGLTTPPDPEQCCRPGGRRHSAERPRMQRQGWCPASCEPQGRRFRVALQRWPTHWDGCTQRRQGAHCPPAVSRTAGPVRFSVTPQRQGTHRPPAAMGRAAGPGRWDIPTARHSI